MKKDVIRMTDKAWSGNMWSRIRAILTGHENRIDALEQGGGGGGGVTGVKGDAESTYRTGNVNLTPANLGAQVYVGFYIDAQGYMCQQISSDS